MFSFCSGECTFEDTNPPLCGWVNVRGRDRIDWNRATGSTASIGTGPSSDHTYGNSKGLLSTIMAFRFPLPYVSLCTQSTFKLHFYLVVFYFIYLSVIF